MNKIPTLFERGPDGLVVDKVTPGCEWVLSGLGYATEKLDGTNVRLTIRSGVAVRAEARRNPDRDQKARGILHPWYRDAANPSDKWIMEAVVGTDVSGWPDGEHCCEALGPKIQSNPLGLLDHRCVAFGEGLLPIYALAPRGYEEVRAWLEHLESYYSPGNLAEGVVFVEGMGARAKIKRKDFGFSG